MPSPDSSVWMDCYRPLSKVLTCVWVEPWAFAGATNVVINLFWGALAVSIFVVVVIWWRKDRRLSRGRPWVEAENARRFGENWERRHDPNYVQRSPIRWDHERGAWVDH
jgi:hypothetical protein